MVERIIYIGMSADILHVGHVNIINTANKLIAENKADRLIVGLLTCEAVESYKRKPIVRWEQRRELLLALKGVETIVSQDTLDYRPNLRKFKPLFCIHGSDWNDPKSAQYATRQTVIDCLAQWGGTLIEPDYTKGISTTHIIDEITLRSSS
mmetsp:Transcript_22833/g.25169  ORF Transcript_22833/g.25169 Transcript_22833/m.25169 type:complete len:151 (-) Transcript_22833:200-652(-)